MGAAEGLSDGGASLCRSAVGSGEAVRSGNRLAHGGAVRWAEGARNGAALWRELRDLGFRGSLRVVAEWASRRRRAEQVNIEGLTRVPSARTVARLMTMARDSLSRTQTVMVATIETAVPTLVQARDLVDGFQTLIRRKQEAALDDWLTKAAASLLASFARGLARDHLAV